MLAADVPPGNPSQNWTGLDTPNPWFCRVAGASGSMILFYFPFAGGNAAANLSWQAMLGPALELQVALLPGRGTRLFEAPLYDLDELVTQLTRAVIDQADRRFAFFGHSLGALVAFEVARTLRRQGRHGPASLWVSGAEGPQTRVVKRRLRDLPEAELIEALHEYQGTPVELLSDREMMRLLLPGLRADFSLNECYSYRPEAPLDLPIHLLYGDRDPYVEPERTAGWARETTRPLCRHRYPGDHFFINAHQADITALLAAELGNDEPRPLG